MLSHPMISIRVHVLHTVGEPASCLFLTEFLTLALLIPFFFPANRVRQDVHFSYARASLKVIVLVLVLRSCDHTLYLLQARFPSALRLPPSRPPWSGPSYVHTTAASGFFLAFLALCSGSVV
ncbi:hypothetical protein HETIRDRAFT_173337 [Heterobasidion irregulare TC 32-1]|uniref:Uncharacterized protein n=1 Tax=Heterobasidion irregulare (strain TC 32-1) TaxID=747525 RepID=W4K8I8_HETIT|nr:uncharacterized protein HETIRDRAFT_173337 [Heterobasidion irregulare TC 32-1]ETW81665.1 hypothetical protein HETIRDRAFT_173337 [Heterobasidion irregulare TC 32-1]